MDVFAALAFLVPLATIVVVVAASVLVLTTPLWMHWAIGATGAGIPGITAQHSLVVSDQTVNQLLGPGTFDIRYPIVCPEGADCPETGPVYTADEVTHLQDARSLLLLFVFFAALLVLLLAASWFWAKSDVRFWRGVRRGGAVLVVGIVTLGVIGFVAFDAGFELFHRIFFPGGNWAFPADSNLIRLYPYTFWQLTAAALGVLCVAAGAVVWFYGRRRAARLETWP